MEVNVKYSIGYLFLCWKFLFLILGRYILYFFNFFKDVISYYNIEIISVNKILLLVLIFFFYIFLCIGGWVGGGGILIDFKN